jgi:hypothetical protein
MKRGIVRSKRPVDLIRRDMQEAEPLSLFAREQAIIRAGPLQQRKGAVDIGPQKSLRPQDRPVDMALRGEMDYCAGSMFVEQTCHQSRVANITMYESVGRTRLQRRQVFWIARIRQLV